MLIYSKDDIAISKILENSDLKEYIPEILENTVNSTIIAGPVLEIVKELCDANIKEWCPLPNLDKEDNLVDSLGKISEHLSDEQLLTNLIDKKGMPRYICFDIGYGGYLTEDEVKHLYSKKPDIEAIFDITGDEFIHEFLEYLRLASENNVGIAYYIE